MKSLVSAVALFALTTTTATAAVRREGTWPEHEPKVTIELREASRHEAIRKLADAAGWSLVIDLPIAGTTPIDVKLSDEEAGKALDVLLRDGNYVAERDGKIVTIRLDASPPPAPGAPAAPTSSVGASAIDDYKITGGTGLIEAGKVVKDAKVVGGALDVYGTINGDLKVVGGAVRLKAGSHVKGRIKIVGGAVTAEDGAVIDGEVKTIGGAFKKGNNVRVTGPSGGRHDDDDIFIEEKVGGGTLRARVGRFGNSVMQTVSNASLLFLFGVVILALGKSRAEIMRLELASRPMRALALGVVGLPAAILVVVMLCITVIGIPFAIVGVCLFSLGVLTGLVTLLQLGGELLVRHKTSNPYAHLGLGVAIYALVGSLPFFGSWVVLAAVLTSIGVFVGTRGAGFIKKRGALPYRSPTEL